MAGRNIGYPDKPQHRYRQYIDLPFSPDGTKLVEPIPPNAQTQIAEFRKALAAADTTENVRSCDLVWLPHATSRFDKAQPEADRGGNDAALCAKPCKDELHALWDDVLGTSKDPKSAIAKASTLAAADPELAKIQEEPAWIQESFQAAKNSVYIEPIGIGPGPFAVNTAYKKKAGTLASQRVAWAGARLAALINSAVGGQ